MAPAQPSSSTLRSWLTLARVPNLFTVPGDPLTGFLLSQGAAPLSSLPRALPAAAAALLLYVAGLISNDYFDLEVDRRERPERPLPSGAIRPAAAGAVSILFAAAGVLAAMFGSGPCGGFAAALAAAILLYNAGGKSIPVWGPVHMGLCRGLSVMMGAAAGGWEVSAHAAWIAAVGLTLYIAAVTAIAAKETEASPVGARRWLPFLSLWLYFGAIALAASVAGVRVPVAAGFVLLGATVLLQSWHAGRRLGRAGAPVPPEIGALIRALLPLQAATQILFPPSGLVTAGLLLVCWPLCVRAGRRFYAS